MRSLIRLLRSGILSVPVFFSPGLSAQEPAERAARADAILLEQVSDFLEYFIDAQKTPVQQAALFASDAQYYEHGKAGKAAIIRDIEYFARRWPNRNYRLKAIHYITPDPASGKVFVSYEIDYRAVNDSRNASGKAYYGAVIADLDSSPKVEWIKERISR